MEDVTKKAIPLKYLPEKWAETVGEEFSLSETAVRKIANGTRNNPLVFDRLMELAEKEKAKADQEEQARLERLKKLTA